MIHSYTDLVASIMTASMNTCMHAAVLPIYLQYMIYRGMFFGPYDTLTILQE